VAVDELLHALEREATAEAEAILAAARADADEVARAATRRAAAHAGAVLAAARAKEQLAADAEVAAVARRWRRDVLAGRAAALDRVHAAVSAALPGLLTGPGGDAVLAALIDGVEAALATAAPTAAGERIVVRCPLALAARVEARLRARPGLTIVGDDAVGAGLVAERAGGEVTIDARLDAALARWWPALRVGVRPADETAGGAAAASGAP
jgi:vacuolar-type H+-ATPase subunit E/Vma4